MKAQATSRESFKTAEAAKTACARRGRSFRSQLATEVGQRMIGAAGELNT